MNNLKLYIIIAFCVLTNSINAQQDSKAIKIVENAIDAMGGKSFLKSISTLYCNSETQMDERAVNWITKEMIPNKGSFEIIYQDRTVYKSWYDGKLGYQLSDGKKVLANQDQFKDKEFKKNIFNEFDYLDTSLYKLEYVSIEDVESRKCNKIKATLINGKITYLYFDLKTSLLTKSETVKDGEANSFSTVIYGDYSKFKKLTYFTKMRFGSNADAQSAKIIELFYNEKINETDFK
ncbi:hypothetical protein [Flavobacterium sp. CF136]|uniref:hypothetical protein n=1 Tax=Flavobacterium sp. (strain CF136) TaxID=1144313 RepID=UPI000271B07D|nr:hypothetical protein [Flavobacterium sp. CF136]EJL62503.1 hypothetical protein PMI10_02882 [Flavobacterium sp. CF136]